MVRYLFSLYLSFINHILLNEQRNKFVYVNNQEVGNAVLLDQGYFVKIYMTSRLIVNVIIII